MLLGVTAFSQSTIFVMTNNTPYNIEARFLTGPQSTSITTRYMYAGPTASFPTFTIPPMFYTKYEKFDSVWDPANNLPMNTWYLIDPTNPAISGVYPPTDPIITSMVPLNEWGLMAFRLADTTTGATADSYEVGDPTVSANLGFSVPTSQIGANTGYYAQWYTIGNITFFQVD